MARGRLQFRLRTLMIVITLLAVACSYIGWQVRRIADRKATLDIIVHDGGGATILDTFQLDKVRKTWGAKDDVPLIRRWLGDVHVHLIAMGEKSSWDDYRHVTELFPEAWVSPPSSAPVRP